MRSCKKLPLAAALILVLTACGREGESPRPPSSAPRPTTFGGKITHALLDMSKRPVPPPPGEM